MLFTRTADFAPGQTRASLGDCAEFPFGFLLLQATAVVEGIAITRPITVETHASALLPHAADTVAGRKRQALEFLARFGEQNTNRPWRCWQRRQPGRGAAPHCRAGALCRPPVRLQ